MYPAKKMIQKTHEKLEKYIFVIKEENSSMERNYLTIQLIINCQAFRTKNRHIKKIKKIQE